MFVTTSSTLLSNKYYIYQNKNGGFTKTIFSYKYTKQIIDKENSLTVDNRMYNNNLFIIYILR